MPIADILFGNNLELLPHLADNSVDAIVTDPPYGLKFMGKKWDYEVPTVAQWKECFRVLKPGGYLLSFAGTRTQHRMACNIEDAGFEIRDMIAWVYGQGFPKSLDIGKQISKINGEAREVIGKDFGTSWAKINRVQKDQGYRPFVNGTPTQDGEFDITKGTSEWEGWGTALKPSFESITVAQKPFQSSSDIENNFVSLLQQIKYELCQYPSFALTAEKSLRLNQKESEEVVSIAQWIAEENINILEDLSVLMGMLQLELVINTSWNIVLSWLTILADLYKGMNMFTTVTRLNMTTELIILNSMEWENIFQNIMLANESQTNGLSVNVWSAESVFNVLKLKLKIIPEHFAQESAISKAGQEDLLPNLDPIIMARKPISEKTIAENILKWGTGGINIDDCRIPLNGQNKISGGCKGDTQHITFNFTNNPQVDNTKGRFPANLIHDGSDEVIDIFPNTKSGSLLKHHKRSGGQPPIGTFTIRDRTGEEEFIGDSGSAARFFYCAKASRSERNLGCEEMATEFDSSRPWGDEESDRNRIATRLVSKQGKNNHPTVKPIKLMEYLIKLVSRDGAVILDPWAGSGTTGCVKLNRKFILMEEDKHSYDIMRARISHFIPEVNINAPQKKELKFGDQMSLF